MKRLGVYEDGVPAFERSEKNAADAVVEVYEAAEAVLAEKTAPKENKGVRGFTGLNIPNLNGKVPLTATEAKNCPAFCCGHPSVMPLLLRSRLDLLNTQGQAAYAKKLDV